MEEIRDVSDVKASGIPSDTNVSGKAAVLRQVARAAGEVRTDGIYPPVRANELVPVSNFFVINESMQYAGPGNSDGYLCNTAESAYKLNEGVNGVPFSRFTVNLTGTPQVAYCLEIDRPGPSEDEAYISGPPSLILFDATKRERDMAAWILANTFPASSVAETFALAGIDPSIPPPLDENDAYAIIQTALWFALGQLNNKLVKFVDCVTGLPHPKSERMESAVFSLLGQAEQYANSWF